MNGFVHRHANWFACLQSLERVLFVWALRHPASGYVQGINDLATPLYSVFLEPFGSVEDPSILTATDEELFNAEADVYHCLTRILDSILVRPCWLCVSSSRRVATVGFLRFWPIEINIIFLVISACVRRPGAASQAFERMHNTLSHRVNT